mmetsp:Transcript_9937/g.31057  ORF Transcript_9937/g.31057 Transcript_9937/m.31057 type:complete len:276 (-) Transcript_9937:1345-2172(-)
MAVTVKVATLKDGTDEFSALTFHVAGDLHLKLALDRLQLLVRTVQAALAAVVDKLLQGHQAETVGRIDAEVCTEVLEVRMPLLSTPFVAREAGKVPHLLLLQEAVTICVAQLEHPRDQSRARGRRRRLGHSVLRLCLVGFLRHLVCLHNLHNGVQLVVGAEAAALRVVIHQVRKGGQIDPSSGGRRHLPAELRVLLDPGLVIAIKTSVAGKGSQLPGVEHPVEVAVAHAEDGGHQLLPGYGRRRLAAGGRCRLVLGHELDDHAAQLVVRAVAAIV